MAATRWFIYAVLLVRAGRQQFRGACQLKLGAKLLATGHGDGVRVSLVSDENARALRNNIITLGQRRQQVSHAPLLLKNRRDNPRRALRYPHRGAALERRPRGEKKKKNNKRKTKSNWNIEKKKTTKKHRLGRLKGETSSPHRSFGVSRLRISYLHRTNNINRTAPADWNPIVDSYFNSLSLRVARTRLSVPIKNHKDVSHTRIIIGWKKKNPYESSGSKICRYTRLGGADCRCRSLIE